MIAFEILDMTCGHCRDAVTRAVLAVDAAATVEVDLPARRVRIDSRAAGPQRFGDAIAAAGYAPRPVAPPLDHGVAPRAGGCNRAAAGLPCGT